MKLIEDYKKAWSWFSVQAMTLAGTLQIVWVSLPSDLKATIPSNVVNGVTVAILVLGIAGRLIKQGDK